MMLEVSDVLRQQESSKPTPDVRTSDFSEALPCAINDDIPTVDQFKLPRGFMNRGLNVG
jgi:hypothetical protein